jgi:uncharacterized membrane protein YsdA (DUF1294 family)/cold shock CspA family protein
MEQRGTLKNWNDQKGFGFIQPEQGGAEVFAHISVVRGADRPQAGDRVLYLLEKDEQGRMRASHLRLDAPMMLDRPAIRRKPASPEAAKRPARQPESKPRRASRRKPAASVQALKFKLLVFAGLLVLPVWGSLQVLGQSHSILPVIAYCVASVLVFLLYWHDKQSALQGRWRTPENTLHLVELLGGWPGALLAQQVFRHKTRKVSYQLLFWGIVLLHQVFWIDYLYVGRIFTSAFVQRIFG